jgi:Ca2+-binding RTX toxin-like protein
LTFTQKSGNPVSFIGTDSNDTLVLTSGQPYSGVTNPSGTYEGGAAWVQAEGGNDIVTTNGNVAGVTVYGGAGDDEVSANGNGSEGQFTNGQVFLDDGDDIFTYFNLVTSGVNGGDGDDTISAGSFATSTSSSINGNAGSDTINLFDGRAGDTGIYGGQDVDFINVSTTAFFTSSVINGNKGADRINIFQTGGASSWNGTEIRGGGDSDTINLIAGNADLGGVYGDLGQDRIIGTNGEDVYAGNISAFGGEGNDSITGGSGDDELDGGLNADVLNGAAGNDTLIGGDGTYSDTFVFGNGAVAPAFLTSATGASGTYAGVAATTVTTALADIDALIGTDLVTDYDLADDNIRVSSATFGGLATVNGAYTGTFGVSSDGNSVTWFNQAAASNTAFIYNQVTGDFYFAVTYSGAAFSDINSISKLNSSNSQLVATLDTTPSINGSNYQQEIFVIA